MKEFNPDLIKKLYKPKIDSSKNENGRVTIIGGSSLFHGAPLLSLKVASRIVDMVFFATPEKSVGTVAEKIKSSILSFIWVPWKEVGEYIEKSDAILIGPGFMRYRSEKKDIDKDFCDESCHLTKSITETLLKKYPWKKWVIDAGSLQVLKKELIPKNSILTPNRKEYKNLFKDLDICKVASLYDCVITLKGPETLVSSPQKCLEVKGGNPGLTKGGTGDAQAGLTVGLFAKNDAFLAASTASFITKKAADELYKKVGVNYNADDLADKIPEVLNNLLKV